MYKIPGAPVALLLSLAVCPPADAAPSKPPTVPFQVQIEGVDDGPRQNVLARLGMLERRKRTEAEIRQLHSRAEDEIRTALEPFGFYRPVILGELERSRSGWRAHYVIDPGPPIHVDSLDVRVIGPGESDPEFQQAIATLPLHRGDVLLHARYEQSKLLLTRAAMKRGYLDGAFARSEIHVDRDRYFGAVILRYASGPQYFFGPVVFQQDVVNPHLLEGYIEFRRGEPLDYDKLLQLEQNLNNSPYWSHVEIRPRRELAQGNELPIVVELTPAKAEKYTFGVGYGTDNGPHARGVAELRRMNRRGHRGGVEGTVSGIERSGEAKYQIPWPYPRTDLLTLSAGYAEIHTNTSDEKTQILGTSLARIWAKRSGPAR